MKFRPEMFGIALQIPSTVLVALGGGMPTEPWWFVLHGSLTIGCFIWSLVLNRRNQEATP